MRDHFQTENTLKNKEIECSAAENLKCLYLCTGYFAQPENFTTFLFLIFCDFYGKPAKVTFYIFFPMKDTLQWSKKITTQSHASLELT